MGMNKKHKNYLEPIGLLLLLAAFGWQCWEEQANQLKYEAYIYDLNQKVDAIWSGVYDEALRSERYHGTASVAVNYDSLNSRFKVWNEAQEEYKTLNGQLSFFFWCRLVLYVLGSYLVILARWPQKRDGNGEC